MSHAHAAPPRFSDPRAFEAWATQQPGKWELHDGVAVAMAPERLVHTQVKAQCWMAFRSAILANTLPCHTFVDGPLVPGPGARRFQPDVLVTCGERPKPDALLVEQPIILVEVLSPSTQTIDHDLKMESYFALPSVRHYLLVSSSRRMIVQHSRIDGGRLLTSLHSADPVELDPPGIRITLDDVYDDVVFE